MTPVSPQDLARALLSVSGRLDAVVQALERLFSALSLLAEAQAARLRPRAGEPCPCCGGPAAEEAVAAALDAHLFRELQRVVAIEVAQGVDRVLQTLGGAQGPIAKPNR